MRRPRKTRHSSRNASLLEPVDTMPQSVASSRPQSRNRDTGFPESFGLRTTNLPHPDADTSPNACISQDDISPQRVLSRQRRSFLAKHKRTISHGVITPVMEQMYSDTAVHSDSEPPSPNSRKISSAMNGKDDSNSLARTSSDLSDETNAAPKPARTRVSSDASSSRHRSFFNRLGVHRLHHQHE